MFMIVSSEFGYLIEIVHLAKHANLTSNCLLDALILVSVIKNHNATKDAPA